MRHAPLLLVALLLLAAPAAAARSAAVPTLSPGDFWETTFETTTGQGKLSSNTRTEIVGPEEITVDGTKHDAVKSSSRTSSTTTAGQAGLTFQLTTTTDATSWFRASDGATIKVVSTSTSSSPFGGAPSTTQTEIVYSPPCAMYEYPLEVGRQWTTTCTARVTSNGQTTESKETYAYRALREESVTVAAGTFDTIVLANGTDEPALTYWAPKACGPVRTAAKSASGTFNADLQSFQCAKSGSFSDGSAGTPSTPPSNPTGSTGSPSPTTPPASGAPTSGTQPSGAGASASGDADTPGLAVPLALAGLAAVALAVARRR